VGVASLISGVIPCWCSAGIRGIILWIGGHEVLPEKIKRRRVVGLPCSMRDWSASGGRRRPLSGKNSHRAKPGGSGGAGGAAEKELIEKILDTSLAVVVPEKAPSRFRGPAIGDRFEFDAATVPTIRSRPGHRPQLGSFSGCLLIRARRKTRAWSGIRGRAQMSDGVPEV